MDFLDVLKAMSAARCEESFQGLDAWSEPEWGCALAGEVGELCNLLKKRKRGDANAPSKAEVASEAADVAIYLDLLCTKMGIDLQNAIRSKFNEVSRRVGSKSFIP